MHPRNSPIRTVTDSITLQGFLFEPLLWVGWGEQEKSLYLMFGKNVLNVHSNIDDDDDDKD